MTSTSAPASSVLKPLSSTTPRLGAFFGYGTTDYKSGLNKIDGEDKHFGVYGLTDIGNVTMTYGVAYTDEDRNDGSRHEHQCQPAQRKRLRPSGLR